MRRTSRLPARAAITWAVALAGVVVGVGCLVSSGDGADLTATSTPTADGAGRAALSVPPPESIPSSGEPVDGDVESAADLVASAGVTPPAAPVVDRLAMSGDMRQAWLLVDALHFHQDA